MSEFSLLAVAVILGMSAVTYATKAGGLWILNQIELSERAHVGLEALPGGIIVAILAPQLVQGSLPEWAAALVVVVVAHRTDSILLALVVGVGSVLLLREAAPMG